MKLNKSIEQGLYVILILALQKNHTPLKSQLLSQRLEVSDSYLKKILRKLVVADLISSNAIKDGGYTLKQPVTELTLFDVSQAVDNLGNVQLPDLHLGERVFAGDQQHVQQSEKLVFQTFQKAQDKYNEELKSLTLDQLLMPGSFQNGAIDWTKVTEN